MFKNLYGFNRQAPDSFTQLLFKLVKSLCRDTARLTREIETLKKQINKKAPTEQKEETTND